MTLWVIGGIMMALVVMCWVGAAHERRYGSPD
jgi:uncharacterized membrane protein YhaH (DUF805 family)